MTLMMKQSRRAFLATVGTVAAGAGRVDVMDEQSWHDGYR
jgi:hypothetical protein